MMLDFQKLLQEHISFLQNEEVQKQSSVQENNEIDSIEQVEDDRIEIQEVKKENHTAVFINEEEQYKVLVPQVLTIFRIHSKKVELEWSHERSGSLQTLKSIIKGKFIIYQNLSSMRRYVRVARCKTASCPAEVKVAIIPGVSWSCLSWICPGNFVPGQSQDKN